jgi:hypothetical protein
LSPALPADSSAIAAALGPSTEVSTAPTPPPGASLVVLTVFERDLLDRLAAVPGAGSLLLLKPPGTATPSDLPSSSGPTAVVEAADVADVTAAIRNRLAQPPTPWPSAVALVGGAGAGDWLVAGHDPAPTGELESAQSATGARHGARRWLATGGILGAAALAAVVVLATQGGASDTSATGFGGPGGPGGFGRFGGYGSPGGVPGQSGTGQSGTGQSNSGQSGSGQSGTSVDPDGDHAARMQAFLACLQENGVDTSGFTAGQRPRLDPSDPSLAKAFSACRSVLPGRGMHGDRDGDDPGAPGQSIPGQGIPGQSTPGQGAPGGAPSTSGGTTGGRTT